MPNLRALMTDRGMTFSRFFSTVPLCAPSRVTFLTGQYAHNHGVRDNAPPLGGFETFAAQGREGQTLAVWLKQGGYRTALIGKYVNGYESADPTHIPPGWDEWKAVVQPMGMFASDAYFNYSLAENGVLTQYGEKPSDYETDVLAAKTTDFIRRTPQGQPFFAYVATAAPHVPSRPPQRYENALPEILQAPRGPAFDEEDVSDKPSFVRSNKRIGERDMRRLDRFYRRRLQTMLAVDDLVASVVRALEETNRLSETYVVFTSDNGFLQGQHRFPRGKDLAYEEAVRVPFIVRGPNVPAGVDVTGLAGNIDLAPTLLSLARVTMPDSIDGRALTPLLVRGGSAQPAWRKDILLEHFSPNPDVDAGNFAAVRTDTHKYVRYERGEEEIYDLAKDPFELENGAKSADAALRSALASRLAALKDCRGAGCRQ